MAMWTLSIFDRLPVDGAGVAMPIWPQPKFSVQVTAFGAVDISDNPGIFARLCGDTECMVGLGDAGSTDDPFVPAGAEYPFDITGVSTVQITENV